jgi:hypothetical protein
MNKYLTFDLYMNQEDLSRFDNSPAERFTFYEIYIPNITGPLYNLHHAVVIVELKDGRTVMFEIHGSIIDGTDTILITEKPRPDKFFN